MLRKLAKVWKLRFDSLGLHQTASSSSRAAPFRLREWYVAHAY